jgi:hypothetical protein
MDAAAQKWACSLIAAKKDAGVKLTSREERIWAYSRYGSAGGCCSNIAVYRPPKKPSEN